MKKIALIVIVAGLIIGVFFAISTYAQSDITITYNGTEIQFGLPPIIQSDRVLVPLSTIKEALDMQISWNDEEQSIHFINIKNGRNYYLAIDRPLVELGDDTLRLVIDVPPTIVNGKIFIPVRFFAERLGFNVDWDENTRTVIITKLTHEEGVTAVITYVNNAGEGRGHAAPPPQVFLLGQTVRLADLDEPGDVYKLDHYFDGWMDPVTGTLYSTGEITYFDSNVILYATFTNVWTNETVW